MPIVPKVSVRTNLTAAILLTVVLSWVVSSGVANYFNYLSFRSFRQEMIKYPDAFPRPIPEPEFGILEFLIGRPPFPRGPREFQNLQHPGPKLPPRENVPEGGPAGPPPTGNPPDHGAFGPPPEWPDIRSLFLRFIVAFGLAALAGAWLGRKFTKPLIQLAQGADAFQSGDFAYRIPTSGKTEFASVATAMNEMARRVSDQINDLEEDAQRRKQFLADIAHELRSPITTMGTIAGALKDGLAEEPDRKEFAVSALVTTSQRLGRLVQDIMELAKLDVGEFPLNIRQVDVRELIESAILSHATEALNAGISLHSTDSAQPVMVNVDPDRLVQVLDNIIENAISYAGEGADVDVSLIDGDPLSININDTGKGICATDIARVCDPFYRVDTARTPGDCHSGLGLSIACKLVEAHHGKLTISSVDGSGTTVTILIPKTPHLSNVSSSISDDKRSA